METTCADWLPRSSVTKSAPSIPPPWLLVAATLMVHTDCAATALPQLFVWVKPALVAIDWIFTALAE